MKRIWSVRDCFKKTMLYDKKKRKHLSGVWARRDSPAVNSVQERSVVLTDGEWESYERIIDYHTGL